MYEDSETLIPSVPGENLDRKLFEYNRLKIKIKTELDSEEDCQPFDSRSSFYQLSKSSVSQSNDLAFKAKTVQFYNQFIDILVENSMKTISDISFNNSFVEQTPNDAWRMSEAVTSAKNSFIDQHKDIEHKNSIHYTSFAVPSKMFCNNCEKEVFTTVSFQLAQPRF